MSAPEPADLAAVRARIQRAQTEIGDIASQGPHRRWRMSIPAQPGRDSDLIIMAALGDAVILALKVEQLRAQRDAARRELARRDTGLPVDLTAMRDRIERASQEIYAIAEGGPDRWRQSVPGRPGHDSDLLIDAGLRDGEHAIREANRLRGLIHEILGRFTQPGHPGEPCRRTGWTSEKQLTVWRQAAGPSPYARGGTARQTDGENEAPAGNWRDPGQHP